MKKNSLILTISLFLLQAYISAGQDMEVILQQIEDNNPYLIAERKHTEMKSLAYRTGLTPANPAVTYGYFPGNRAAPGDKSTLDIMQSFDFPTTYIQKKKLAGNQIEKSIFMEESIRQDILYQAKLILLDLTYLQNMGKELSFRLKMAEKLFADFERKLEEGSGDIVELNRARLELVSAMNRLKRNEADIRRQTENLNKMNGGIEIEYTNLGYSERDLISLDSLISNSLEHTARIRMLGSDRKVAQSNVKLQKAELLPSFELGYGSEMVADEAFRGGRVGISIPLWEDKNRIKTARAYADYTQLVEESIIAEFKSEIKQDYLLATTLKGNLEELHSMLSTLRDHEILARSLESGQISSIEYFVEVAYYYELMDQMLETEKEYMEVVARLYKYEL